MSLRSKPFRLIAVILGLLIVSGAAALFVPPPRTITRALAVAGSRWLVRDDGSDNRIAVIGRRLFGSYIQYAIAAAVARDLALDTLDDERALNEALQYVQTHTLNQPQYAVPPENVPILVRGAGTCDQINAAVATIAARRFEKVQMVWFYDPVRKMSPHMVGRAWSPQRREWIYFDGLFADAVMYTIGPDGKRHFLEQENEAIPSRQHNDRALYDMGGYVVSSFPATFGEYVLARARQPRRAVPKSEPTVPIAAIAAPTTDASGAPAAAPPAIDDDAFDDVADAFVAARMDHLFGARAAASYRRIGNDPRATVDERAAEIASLARRLAILTAEAPARAANDSR